MTKRTGQIRADKHSQESLRIETLHSYDVLDTSAEADFDDIVLLASEICEVPVSLISLVDQDRQWFKARVGFDPKETSLDQSVCAHSILQDGFFEIADMAQDDRTADMQIDLGGRDVNFYAGVNLVAPNGMPIGTLCVLDNKARALTPFQRSALRTLSHQVMTQLELRKKLKQEKSLKSEMDHRVKNSLQTIGSLLSMASRQVSDPIAIEILDVVNRRIGAVASLHSELMGRDGQGSVDIGHYLSRVVALLTEMSPDHVTLSASCPDATLDANKASAIGMIVSEFSANSIKHAFTERTCGAINIVMSKTGDGYWLLSCEDDGIGTQGDDGLADLKQQGLGQLLMVSAAAQLDGDLQYDSTPDGTRMTVKFMA